MKSDNNRSSSKIENSPNRRSWERMKLIYIGDISEVVRGGGGKLSTTGGDPGENRKPPGGNT